MQPRAQRARVIDHAPFDMPAGMGPTRVPFLRIAHLALGCVRISFASLGHTEFSPVLNGDRAALLSNTHPPARLVRCLAPDLCLANASPNLTRSNGPTCRGLCTSSDVVVWPPEI